VSVEPRLAERGQSSGTPRIRRVLTRWDLILYGIVILTPTARPSLYTASFSNNCRDTRR
jgi:hypothetical protein